MTTALQRTSDSDRVAALRRLDVLDKPRRRDLDSLTRLAAHICNVPTAAINLIDADRQWPAAAFGWEPGEVRRCDSMCSTSIESADVSYTPDASRDDRWVDNPFTNGEIASVRFYASAPLVTSGGAVIGTMCAFDTEVLELDRVKIERLRDIADLAAQLLELHEETERLGNVALRDSLTGLPNRELFIESLDHAIAQAGRGRPCPAVLFLDIDGFKAVNDVYGHAAGDEVLCEVGRRLVDTVRAVDVVARLGGDEFVILCDGSAPGSFDTRAVEARLRERIDAPIVLMSVEHHPLARVGVSIGTTVVEAEDTCAGVLRRADAAMYRDKLTRPRRCAR